MTHYLLGYDIGSSSIKAALLDGNSGRLLASATSPDTELPIDAPRPGFAEQSPELWWKHVIATTEKIRSKFTFCSDEIAAIGIAYQMHGLVLVGKDNRVLRPAIIWCDSRAVPIGEEAFQKLGRSFCLNHFLNSPGNFTAAKLRWVIEHEPHIIEKADKALLPGDYIALRMTGESTTTTSGLSEGIFWDFKAETIAAPIINHFKIPTTLIPRIVDTFSAQGELTQEAATALGLKKGTLVSYRAGDQPNNAFALNVLHPGQIAATAGTSGVVYGVSDSARYDERSRVNTFLHVNHSHAQTRYGVLLCINGCGMLNSWLRKLLNSSTNSKLTYQELDRMADQAPPGADGLLVLPYGNGAERSLDNLDLKATFCGINLNQHGLSHLIRASQEGIIFALRYGLEIMRGLGISGDTVSAGKANMFLNPVFAEMFSTVNEVEVLLVNTDGAQGAARGAGIGAGFYKNSEEAFRGLEVIRKVEPDRSLSSIYHDIYGKWLAKLQMTINSKSS